MIQQKYPLTYDADSKLLELTFFVQKHFKNSTCGSLWYNLLYFSDWALPFSDTLPELLAGNCSDDCMENSKLVDHIRSVIVHPSGHLPVMSNPSNMMLKGQEGQVNTILKHFKEKVSAHC